ncbi:hypothetical protein [Nocardia sp. MW-W600-9]
MSMVPDLGADGARSGSAVDRALGGRSGEELSLAEIEAIINSADELLSAEETLGDLDTGEEEITALLPAEQRNAPSRTTSPRPSTSSRHRSLPCADSKT